MPSLTRTRDGAGDSGALSQALDVKDGQLVVVGNRPIVGAAMRVGSLTARSYSGQDYWTTTRVAEILEEREDYVRFKTVSSGSEYVWRD